MFFSQSRKRKWNQAHEAEPKFYKRGDEVLGVFALTESTDTIYPINPSVKITGKYEPNWEILFIPLGNEPPIGSDKYEVAIRLLKQYADTEEKGEYIYMLPEWTNQPCWIFMKKHCY